MAVSDAVKIEREKTKQAIIASLNNALANPFISSLLVFVIVEYLKRGVYVTKGDTGKKEPWMGGANGDLLEGAVLSADVMKAMANSGILDKIGSAVKSGTSEIGKLLPLLLASG